MKVHKLILQNIGPFTSHTEVDFTKLGEIFLICGKTGSGKTTLFDSITYALYGKLSGSRSRQERMLRSQYAHTDDESFIHLEFSIAGKPYTIIRTPPCIYSNRNEKPSTVLFFAGETLVANRLQEADQEILKVISLSKDEFSKIVLLPQGAFADFLRLNSHQRKEALAKLFPVEMYTKITDKAGALQSDYKAKIAEIQNQIVQTQSEWHIADFEKDLHALTQEELEQKHVQSDLQKKLEEQAGKLGESHRNAQKLKEYTALRERETALLERKDTIEQMRNALRLAQSAEKIAVFIEQKENLAVQLQKIQAEVQCCANDLEQAQQEQKTLTADQEQMVQIEAEIGQNKVLLNRLQTAIQLEEKLTDIMLSGKESRALGQKYSAEIAKMQEQILPLKEFSNQINTETDAIIELQEKDFNSHKELEEARNAVENTKKSVTLAAHITEVQENLLKYQQHICDNTNALQLLELEIAQLEQEKKDLEQAYTAGSLAQVLQQNEPCPVCGSCEHPSPAIITTGKQDYSLDEKLARKKTLVQTTQQAKNEAEKRYSGLYSQHEEYCKQQNECDGKRVYASIEQAHNALNAAVEQRTQAKNALDTYHRSLIRQKDNQQKILALEEKIANLQEKSRQVQTNIDGLDGEHRANTQQLQTIRSALNVTTTDTNLSKMQTDIATKMQDDMEQIEVFRTKKAHNAESLARLDGRQKGLMQNEQNLCSELALKSNTVTEKLTQALFADEQTCLQYLLNKADVEHQQNSVDDWTKQMNDTQVLLTQLKHDLPQTVLPNLAELEKEYEQTKSSLEGTNEQLQRINTEKQILLERKKGSDTLNARYTSLTQDSEVLNQLADDLSGKNPLKTTFESWILGLYLEEITIHASRRLERISEGRYTLLLNTEKVGGYNKFSGLDLEVFDSYTGKRRPCETLSGGETFLASISLALALTDVVQSQSGGVKLDSLFIDEGFGSLDEATLEKALGILDEIRESRMIGIISHVSELKNRIPSRLEINKTSTGSTVTQI